MLLPAFLALSLAGIIIPVRYPQTSRVSNTPVLDFFRAIWDFCFLCITRLLYILRRGGGGQLTVPSFETSRASERLLMVRNWTHIGVMITTTTDFFRGSTSGLLIFLFSSHRLLSCNHHVSEDLLSPQLYSYLCTYRVGGRLTNCSLKPSRVSGGGGAHHSPTRDSHMSNDYNQSINQSTYILAPLNPSKPSPHRPLLPSVLCL